MDKKNLDLETESIGKLLFNYSLPAIIATTASSLYNIIDRIIIGQGVGPLAISGLALTFPIMNLAVAFGTLVGAGASAMVSIRMGQKKRTEAIRILGNAFMLNIAIGIIFSVLTLIFLDPILNLFGASDATLPYARDFMKIILMGNVITHVFFGLNNIMRASGYPAKAMVSILLTVVINIILAPLFIFVFHWGIKGAAFATVISQTVGMTWVLIHFFSKKPYIHFYRSGGRISFRIIRDIFAIGLSPFLIHTVSSLVAIIMNLQLKVFGGDFAIGAYGIIISITSFIVMVVFGLTQGMQPIVGYNYGAQHIDRVVATLKITILWATAISAFGFLAAMIFPVQITHAFTTDAVLEAFTVRGMRLTMAAFIFVGLQVVVSNFFQSIGKAKIAIFLSMSRQVIFLIPFLLILPHFYKLDGVWIASPAADFLAALTTVGILLFNYNKLKKNKLNSDILNY